MSKKNKALLYNFIAFAAIYTIVYLIVGKFTNLTGYWIPITSAVIASLMAPKFQSVSTKDGEKLFMKWLFISGIREVK